MHHHTGLLHIYVFRVFIQALVPCLMLCANVPVCVSTDCSTAAQVIAEHIVDSFLRMY